MCNLKYDIEFLTFSIIVIHEVSSKWICVKHVYYVYMFTLVCGTYINCSG